MGETKVGQTQAETIKKGDSAGGGNLRRSITGGLIGATVGYLSVPENGKKLVETGSGLGQKVKENSKKAVDSILNSPSKLLNKGEGIVQKSEYAQPAGENETSINHSANHKGGENSQNNNINARLDRLEEMLVNLIQSKNDETSGNQRKEQTEGFPGSSGGQPQLINESGEQDSSQSQKGIDEKQSELNNHQHGSTDSDSYLQKPLHGATSGKEQQHNETRAVSQEAGIKDNQDEAEIKDSGADSKLAQSKGNQVNDSKPQAHTENQDDDKRGKAVERTTNKNENQPHSTEMAIREDHDLLKKDTRNLENRLGKIEELLTKMLEQKSVPNKEMESKHKKGKPEERKEASPSQNETNEANGEHDSSNNSVKDSQNSKSNLNEKKKQFNKDLAEQHKSQESNGADRIETSQKNKVKEEDGREVKDANDKIAEKGEGSKKYEPQENHDQQGGEEDNISVNKAMKAKQDNQKNALTKKSKRTNTDEKSNEEVKEKPYNVLSDDETYLILDGLRKEM